MTASIRCIERRFSRHWNATAGLTNSSARRVQRQNHIHLLFRNLPIQNAIDECARYISMRTRYRFGRFTLETCIVYLDDITLFNKYFEEHITHLNEALSALKEAGVTIHLDKCEFFGGGGGLLEAANKNTSAIKKLIESKTQTQLRSSLGM